MKMLLSFLTVLCFFACDTYSIVSTNSVEPVDRVIPVKPRANRTSSKGLPANPDPNRCYVECITLDKYNEVREEFLSYTPAEADEYPHEQRIIEVSPAISRWEYTDYEDKRGDDGKIYQVLCFREYAATYDTVYVPVDKNLGNPIVKTVTTREVYRRGGLKSWEEVDCELTSFTPLPIEFERNDFGLSPTDQQIIDSHILEVMEEIPVLHIEIVGHTDSRGDEEENMIKSQLQVGAVIDYLISKGIEDERLTGNYYGETRLKNRCSNNVNCSEQEHQVNNRIEYRALNQN